MKLKSLLLGAALAGSLAAAAAPAWADWDHDHGGDWHGGPPPGGWHGGPPGGWHGHYPGWNGYGWNGGHPYHDWHGHGWWVGHIWHWYPGWGPGYGYYGPPPIWVAPPAYYPPPPPPVMPVPSIVITPGGVGITP